MIVFAGVLAVFGIFFTINYIIDKLHKIKVPNIIIIIILGVALTVIGTSLLGGIILK